MLKTNESQNARSFVRVTNSVGELWGGTSIRRLSGRPSRRCSPTFWSISRPGPARKMCPSHLKRPTRICLTRLKVEEVARASWRIVFPVNLANIVLLVPLILRIMAGVSLQVSHPYVKIEHTTTLYRRSFSPTDSCWASSTWRRLPHLVNV